MHYRYTLAKEEAIRYHEMVARASKDVKIAQVMAIAWGPALAVLVLLLTGAYDEVMWLVVAIAFSLVWMIGIFPIIFRYVIYVSAERELKKNKVVYKEVVLDIDETGVKVDGKDKTINDFYIYFDLLIIVFSDGTDLIVPERIFNGDEDKMQAMVKAVVALKEERCPENYTMETRSTVSQGPSDHN